MKKNYQTLMVLVAFIGTMFLSESLRAMTCNRIFEESLAPEGGELGRALNFLDNHHPLHPGREILQELAEVSQTGERGSYGQLLLKASGFMEVWLNNIDDIQAEIKNFLSISMAQFIDPPSIELLQSFSKRYLDGRAILIVSRKAHEGFSTIVENDLITEPGDSSWELSTYERSFSDLESKMDDLSNLIDRVNEREMALPDNHDLWTFD